VYVSVFHRYAAVRSREVESSPRHQLLKLQRRVRTFFRLRACALSVGNSALAAPLCRPEGCCLLRRRGGAGMSALQDLRLLHPRAGCVCPGGGAVGGSVNAGTAGAQWPSGPVCIAPPRICAFPVDVHVCRRSSIGGGLQEALCFCGLRVRRYHSAGRFGESAGAVSECSQLCSPGAVSNAGSSECTICPRGKYASVAGSQLCSACLAGFTCGEGSSSAFETPCPAGTWSGPGSWNCTACAAGRFGGEPAESSPECMGLCPPGKYAGVCPLQHRRCSVVIENRVVSFYVLPASLSASVRMVGFMAGAA
jgi:hypothetical protein